MDMDATPRKDLRANRPVKRRVVDALRCTTALRTQILPGSWRSLWITVARAGILCLLAYAATRSALKLGGGPPSLFWPTNGVIILFLERSPSALDFLLATAAGMSGLAIAQTHLISVDLAFKLAAANAVEFMLASVVMSRVLRKNIPLAEEVQTFRFLALLVFFTGVFASSIGAAAGAFVLTREFPGSSYIEKWTDWFIGDLTGNFIVLYIGSLMLANCTREKFVLLWKVLKTGTGFVHLVACLSGIAVVVGIYSIGNLTRTQAVPLMLLVSPMLGNIALYFPQVVSAAIDLVLVLSAVIGTRAEKGPLYTILDGACGSSLPERDIFMCIQVTLFLSATLTSTLAVSREQRVLQARRIKAASDEKVAFFTHASHEFRTPLSVIIGFTEDLLEHRNLQPEMQADLQNVLHASVGMSAMVDDLLALFRLETRGLGLVARPVQTRGFLCNFFAFATRLCSSKSQRLTMTARLPSALVFDPHRVNQVLTNLVANAIKFAPDGGAITISATLKPLSPDDQNVRPVKRSHHFSSSLVNLDLVHPKDVGANPSAKEDGDRERNVREDVKTGVVEVVRTTWRNATPSKTGEAWGNGGESKREDRRISLDCEHVCCPQLRCSPVCCTSTTGVCGTGHEGFCVDVSGGGDSDQSYCVDVSGSCDGNTKAQLVLSVTDTGPGIKPEDLPRVFDRFFRGSNAQAQGTGLGLTICRSIAQAMGGNISVTSEYGVGTTFTIACPVTRAYEQSPLESYSSPQRVDRNIGFSEAKNEESPRQGRSPTSLMSRDTPGKVFVTTNEDQTSSPPNLERLKHDLPVRWNGQAVSGEDVSESAGPQQRGKRDLLPSATLPQMVPRTASQNHVKTCSGNGIEVEQRRGTKTRTSGSGSASGTAQVWPKTRVSVGRGVHNNVGSSADSRGSPGMDGSSGGGRQGGRTSVVVNEERIRGKEGHVGEVRKEGSQELEFALKILLVEDSLPNQKLMSRILERAGHTVEAVDDGQKAIDILISGAFELIVLDLGLPVKSGMEVLKELRAMPSEAIRNTPVIISSGHVLDEHRRRCLEAGCNAFTEKPFRAKVIVDTVQRVIREHRQRGSRREMKAMVDRLPNTSTNEAARTP